MAVTFENIGICKTIIAITEAREFISNNLVSKDGEMTTFLEPLDKLDYAILEQIRLLAYENGLTIEEL